MKRQRILKYGFTFGAIAGLVCFLFFIALYLSDPNPLNIRRPDIGFNIIFVFVGIWYFKRRSGGILHFYEGFSIGFLINIVAALISGIAIYLFITLYDASPFDMWIKEGVRFLENQKESLDTILNEESFNLQVQALKDAKPYQIILDELMFKQLGIIAISLISMALRRHDSILNQK